jgi:sugar phosphate isomerase/epimerase
MIRFSYNTWNHGVVWGLEPDLPAQIIAAAQAGYDYVGLDLPSVLAHESSGLTPRTLRDLMDDHGIACFEIVPLVIGSEESEQNLEDLERIAPVLGAQEVLAVVRAEPTRALVSWTKAAVQRLSALDLGTSLEFLPGSPIRSIAASLTFLDQVDEANLRIDLDSWHYFAGPSDWSDLEGLSIERIGFVQFGDTSPPVSADEIDEYRHRRRLPGDGQDDLQRFSQTMLAKSRDLTVSVEILSREWRERPAGELVSASLAASRPFWSK